MGTYQDLYNRLKDDPEALQVEIEDTVRLSRDLILTDILTQAQRYMTWSYLHALAETDARRLKLNMEEDVLPAARLKAIVVLKEAGEKVTVQSKDDIARSDPSYKQVQVMHNAATQRAMIFRRVVEALGHKRDMIQSLNSRQKVELSALPEDESIWQHKYGTDNEASSDQVDRIVDVSTNHGTVEEEIADLAKTYRSERRERRTNTDE